HHRQQLHQPGRRRHRGLRGRGWTGKHAPQLPPAGCAAHQGCSAVSREPHTLRDIRKIAGGGSSILLASAIGNGLSYLYSIFLARSLSPGDFGVYALGLALFNVLALMAPLGFETGALRFISSALARRDLAAA